MQVSRLRDANACWTSYLHATPLQSEPFPRELSRSAPASCLHRCEHPLAPSCVILHLRKRCMRVCRACLLVSPVKRTQHEVAEYFIRHVSLGCRFSAMSSKAGVRLARQEEQE